MARKSDRTGGKKDGGEIKRCHVDLSPSRVRTPARPPDDQRGTTESGVMNASVAGGGYVGQNLKRPERDEKKERGKRQRGRFAAAAALEISR